MNQNAKYFMVLIEVSGAASIKHSKHVLAYSQNGKVHSASIWAHHLKKVFALRVECVDMQRDSNYYYDLGQ